jgi:hypothetical protein
VCRGPLTAINGKFGKETVKAYTCAYHRDRGSEVCPSSIRRPVVAVNAAVADWIHANVLNEEVLLETLRRLRQRLSERTQATNAALPDLERETKRLRTEIGRLVKALALSDDAPGRSSKASPNERRSWPCWMHGC